jgi:hypothetical protein
MLLQLADPAPTTASGHSKGAVTASSPASIGLHESNPTLDFQGVVRVGQKKGINEATSKLLGVLLVTSHLLCKAFSRLLNKVILGQGPLCLVEVDKELFLRFSLPLVLGRTYSTRRFQFLCRSFSDKNGHRWMPCPKKWVRINCAVPLGQIL